ncbi:MAG: transglycosylase domain-containing protein [Myxococcales bacterium]|nr:transglycosylase domain-containing protein [Myxococcales bacterium]
MTPVVIGNRRRGGGWWRLALVVIAWLAIAAPTVGALWAITTVRGWARTLPPVPDLAAWRARAPATSTILARDGTVLTELPFDDGGVVGRRRLVALAEVPPVLIQAVLAAEDVRFYRHHGVDYAAVARAAWINWRAGRTVEGASTITQQVARNLVPEIGRARSAERKVREALVARQLERRWPKDTILESYLNFVFLGSGAYGVAAGAEDYFGKALAAVTVDEAALLAGLIQAPTRLDPRRDPTAARARRDEVLARMRRAGFIDEATRADAAARPLALAPAGPPAVRAPWYADHVRRLLEESIPLEVAQGGLEVETAALPALAARVDATLAATTAAWADDVDVPEAAAIAWDHRSGYVLAVAGGRAWQLGGFDRLTQACRQPGSAWKPIVYAAALERGALTEGTALRDAPIAEYDEATAVHWKPRSGARFRGVAVAADALAYSLNTSAIDVLDRVGAPAVIDLARRLGVTTAISELRPMALGASCVIPLELARAYAIVARDGWDVAVRVIVRVRHGDQVLFDAAAPDDPWLDPARRLDRLAAVAGLDPAVRAGATRGRIVDERTAFLVRDLLVGVVTRGTARAARALGRPAAGKTGTTNHNSDTWFVGLTADTTAAVWIGHDDPARSLGRGADGAHVALPAWMEIVRAVEGARPPAPVPGPPPVGLARVRIDRETGLLAAPGGGGALDLWFAPGTAPTERAGTITGAGVDFGRAARQF